MKTKDNCHVDPHDLWIMLLSTVRYSMGRMTYMTTLAGELVIKYEKYLKKGDLRQIAREIEEELLRCSESSGTLGMEMDDRVWRDSASKIRELEENRI